ncbi:hypothetical protein B0H63DRAFT_263701 [Podospora didyma]|uniref:Uncharacterized protein n=1 Tax=Podospora didyma TaxID=330526 RepID=A0AAE0KF27_9PEZI|nr:hypothetical protein B0H63DRAFT_263701 [Podospora didyma]
MDRPGGKRRRGSFWEKGQGFLEPNGCLLHLFISLATEQPYIPSFVWSEHVRARFMNGRAIDVYLVFLFFSSSYLFSCFFFILPTYLTLLHSRGSPRFFWVMSFYVVLLVPIITTPIHPSIHPLLLRKKE